MDEHLTLAFCQPCQTLFAPWHPTCPACAWRMVAVWVTDAQPELISRFAEETDDGSVLEVCLEDEAEHAALIADLLVRAAARAA
ncbi:MAG TPA: hypothetical protein QGF05_07020 [Dehalococcoidia bacterium]|nr:hypothetical protein [Dehalococcoidia bacterium]